MAPHGGVRRGRTGQPHDGFVRRGGGNGRPCIRGPESRGRGAGEERGRCERIPALTGFLGCSCPVLFFLIFIFIFNFSHCQIFVIIIFFFFIQRNRGEEGSGRTAGEVYLSRPFTRTTLPQPDCHICPDTYTHTRTHPSPPVQRIACPSLPPPVRHHDVIVIRHRMYCYCSCLFFFFLVCLPFSPAPPPPPPPPPPFITTQSSHHHSRHP